MTSHLALLQSRPTPLGVSRLNPDIGDAFNFAVFSEHAVAVDLILFDRVDPRREIATVRLPHRTDRVWHVAIGGLSSGQPYGYRVCGPYEPQEGHRFNPNKLLVDPYARALDGATRSHPLMTGGGDLKRDEFDSGGHVTRSVVVDDCFDWEEDRHPETPLEHTIVYELHVKGFTKRFAGIPEEVRGTYAALGSEPVVAYLRDLGVTAVQLLPVQQHIDDGFLVDRGLTNYWGYNTIGFFAPEARYAMASPSEGAQVAEFKEMVKQLHRAGIEVILDVVYNHTAEGNHNGVTLCFRGFDNRSYYRLEALDPKLYSDFTGTGNTFNTPHAYVLQLVLDSLRYWVTEMHVDGFRFDLAATLGREPTDFNRDAAFFKAIQADPVLSRVKLFAEPWDLGWGGYQVGNFPARWSELNGRYRDAVRQFWKGDHHMLPEFTFRFTGSEDIYGFTRRLPQSSINFITSHDGFPLNDLVSYNSKHNEANLENNRDGDENNHSWNHGCEGPTDDHAIRNLREQQRRNFIATMMFSQGVPFLMAGDEIGRTQGGNNNAYCQDNEISWLDWELDRSQKRFLEFVIAVIRLRKEHPIFAKDCFFHGNTLRGTRMRDVLWFNWKGALMTPEQWHEDVPGEIAALMSGKTRSSQGRWRESGRGRSFLFLFNATAHQRTFNLPGTPNVAWRLEIDTARAGGTIDREKLISGTAKCIVPSRSLSVLTLESGSEEDAQVAC